MIIRLVPLLSLLSIARATHLSDKTQQAVWDVMNQISTHSWENGTKVEAILESKYARYSVFGSSSPFPLTSGLGDQMPEVMDVAQVTMNNRPAAVNASQNAGSLLKDDAAGDPASLGISILLANASTGNQQVKGIGYGDAATAQLNYLLYDVPRTTSGAISHRANEPQLWSDSVYMVPPFLAFYGAVHNNQTLLQLAYEQCKLYREALKQDTNLWRHIAGGNGTSDPKDWATGNGWAAAGMLRVWATMKWSGFADQLSNEMGDLVNWIREILDASKSCVTKKGLFHNWMTDKNSFEDASAAALLSTVGLRLSTLNITNDYVDTSLNLLSAASSYVNSTGYLTNVVNPLDFSKPSDHSPEGQSFLIMAYAAHKDWDNAGRAGHTKNDGLGKNSGAEQTVARFRGFVASFVALLAISVSL
nr:hypothetical protein L203_04005 [Cryptococcus depauperatus CBS 7841]